MRPRRSEPRLFDLPLEPASKVSEAGAPVPRRGARRPLVAESLPLFGEPGVSAPENDEVLPPAAGSESFELSASREAPAAPAPAPPLGPRPLPDPPAPARGNATGMALSAPPLVARLRATLANLVVYGGLLALVWLGLAAMGREVQLDDAPAVALFVLAFSFLYTVIPLAFWGQTPGMVWAGLVARCGESEPLAFGQTARRWLGGLLTLLLAGLPGLLALRGGSLTDRLSGSTTWHVEHRASGPAGGA